MNFKFDTNRFRNISRAGAFSALMAATLTLSPCQVFAHTSAAPGFDLGSTARTGAVGLHGGTAVLQVGKQNLNVSSSTLLTPAEQIALQQILSTGHQSLLLNQNGSAVGGSFQLNLLGTQVSSGLSIPRGVTAIDTVNSNGSLNFGGNLINNGNLLVVSSIAHQSGTAQISAQNIFNMPGAFISSSGLFPALNNSTSHLSLSLSAVQDFVNEGVIRSSGNLSITAGGSIVNALPARTSGAAPVLQAANNVSLSAASGNISNSGLISALQGNVNISTLPTADLVFNNIGGRVEALAGTINFRDASYQGLANMTLTGGNFSAGSVNLYSGQGNVDVNVDGLKGVLNVDAHCAHVTAATNTLDLGTMNLSGDPTFYNTTGDVLISGDLVFPGESLAIVANGNILSAPGAGIIRTSSDVLNGGSILMVAGANFTVSDSSSTGSEDRSNTLTIQGGSTTGGAIDLSTGGGITALNSSSSAPSGSGGDITLVAYAGSAANSGSIKLPASVTITTGGHYQGSNGNVNIIAGAPQGTAVSIGSINTGGGIGGGGNIAIETGQPLIVGSNASCSPCVVVQPGGAVAYTSGWFSVEYWWNTESASVSTGALKAPGASVNIFAGKDVKTGSIAVNGVAGGDGGSIYIDDNGNINVAGTLQANGSWEGGNGGSISIWANSGDLTVAGPISVNGRGSSGNGGWIDLGASTGNVSIQGNVSANGSGSADGGGVWVNSGGNLFINGSATADGAGGGNGGSVGFSSNGSNPFLAGGATVNGVAGLISAQAGQGGNGGSGGSIYISNYVGTSGIVVPSYQNMSVAASPGGGNGGSIYLDAGRGALLVPQGKLSVDGIGGGSGGYISLTGDTLVVTGSGGQTATQGLSLSANGDGAGQAGGVTVSVNSGDLTVGNQVGQFAISAQGGSSSAAGGYVSLTAGGNLTVDAGSMKTGNAAQIYLSAGNNGSGNLLVTGSLIADSSTGRGGTINLSCNSSSPFVIGAASTNGVTGTVSANASSTNLGDGGSITVNNAGAGGITVSDTGSLSASAGSLGGNGGTISLNAGNGMLRMSQGTLSVDGHGNDNYSVPLSTTGVPFILIRPSTICCNGGNIILQGAGIKVSQVGGGDATGTLNLSANGSAGGNAGSISIVTQSGDIAIGQKPGQITVSAISGNTFSSSNGGGWYPPIEFPMLGGTASPAGSASASTSSTSASTSSASPAGSANSMAIVCCMPIFCCGNNYTGKVFISAGGKLTVDSSALAAGPAAGTNANGANIYLIAGTGEDGGNLQVSGSLSANGSGTGNGGRIVLASNSSDKFAVSPAADRIGNGVSGTVTANGVNGGTIIVASAGDYKVDDGALQVTGSSGSNGTITFKSFDEASKAGDLCCAGAQFNFWWWRGGPGPVPLALVSAATPAGGTSNSGGPGGKVAGPPAGGSGGAFDFSHSSGLAEPTRTLLQTELLLASGSTGSSGSASSLRPAQSSAPIESKTDESAPDFAVLAEDEGSNSLLPTDLTPRGFTLASAETGSAKSGDNAAVSGTAEITVSYISSVGDGSSFKLQSGNMLLAPEGDIVVETRKGKIQIARGCVALVMTSGFDVAVYDLHDSSSGGIKAIIGNEVIPLSLGGQIVLTGQKEGSFEEINPGATIAYRQLKDFSAANGTRVFSAEFSLVSTIAQIRPLNQMLSSGDPKDRQIIGQIKRNAAIITQISGAHGPYKTSKRLTANAL